MPLSHQERSVLAELKAHDNGSGFVFPSPTRRGRPFTNYAKAGQRVKDAARLSGKPCNIYHLKDTCLTGLQRLKVPGAVVSAAANHLPTTVTARHYAGRDLADEKRKALDKWGRHMEKLEPTTTEEVIELRPQPRRGHNP